MTQKQLVIDKLERDGEVNNFWAIQNYILRLGAIIHELKKEGWVFKGQFGYGKEEKNYYYHLLNRPEVKMKKYVTRDRNGNIEKVIMLPA